MSFSSNLGANDSSTKLPSSCPFMGLLSDPQTHVGVPDSRNCCHLVKPARSVAGAYQEVYCLTQYFVNCEVYVNSGEGPIPPELEDAEATRPHGFSLPKLKLRRSQHVEEAQPEDVEITPRESVITSPREDFAESSQEMSKQVAQEAEIAPADNADLEFEDDDDLANRLRYEALAGYDKIGMEKKNRNRWVILLVVALVILVVSLLGVFQRLQYLQRQSQEATDSYQAVLATQIQEMGAASGAWETAAGLIQVQAATDTAMSFASATAAVEENRAFATAQAATEMSMSLTATASINVCQDLRSSTYEIISGPELTPKAGTIIQPGGLVPRAESSWILKNTGRCSWEQVLLWSIADNNILQPVLKKDGVEIDLMDLDGKPLLSPGEQLEIVMRFDSSNAREIKGEWVIVVNGLTLNNLPHLVLDVKNWIIQIQNTEAPTRVIRTPKATPKETSEPPPNRP